MWKWLLLSIAVTLGFWLGNIPKASNEVEISILQNKSFVVVLYAHNQASWCKRSLSSIFGQDYENYRVVVVDDGSVDGTEELAKEFVIENYQDEKVILIRNENPLGPLASLKRVMDYCSEEEIVIPMEAKDWLASPIVLRAFNVAHQKSQVHVAMGWGIEYPSYKIEKKGPISFYPAQFDRLRHSSGRFEMKGISNSKISLIEKPLGFHNLTVQSYI